MGSIERHENLHVDVMIVGAGISGINAGYRVQTELPGYSYTILEARNARISFATQVSDPTLI
jgi:cation diffusion facilitator CzcD-associated flavoprotein CzcO